MPSSATPTTQIYTRSLHAALPICQGGQQSYEVPHLVVGHDGDELAQRRTGHEVEGGAPADRLVLVPELPGQLGGTEGVVPAGGDQVGGSEEHTSELQSRGHIVCRLLLEKK